MRKIKFYSLAVATMLSSFFLLSCSSDDGGSNGTYEPTKRIKKMTEVYPSGIIKYECSFTYNTEGQIIKVDSKQYSGNNSYTRYTYTFTYSSKSIICHESTSTGNERDRIFNLSNGLIIDNASYDDNGYLTSKDGNKYVWENGNAVEIGTNVIQYSNIIRPQHWMSSGNYRQVLEAYGYYGKTSKNLESHVIPPTSASPYYEKYDYTVENGYITKYTYTSGTSSTTTTIIWE